MRENISISTLTNERKILDFFVETVRDGGEALALCLFLLLSHQTNDLSEHLPGEGEGEGTGCVYEGGKVCMRGERGEYKRRRKGMYERAGEGMYEMHATGGEKGV